MLRGLTSTAAKDVIEWVIMISDIESSGHSDTVCRWYDEARSGRVSASQVLDWLHGAWTFSLRSNYAVSCELKTVSDIIESWDY